ncbi:immunoglobulin domain-containing protein [Vibrio parahaemolyticus]|nr:immunoglobulin domain-containing protein [Vibrio parahaemolyticus]
MALYIDGTEILKLIIDGTEINEMYIDGTKVARKPMINTQPVGGTITDAETLTLSVVADGLGSTMSYQWYNGSEPISGATGTSYVFTPSSTGNHTFFCRVTGFGGYTDTDTVTVVVEQSTFTLVCESWDLPLYAGIYYGYSTRLGGETHGSITPDNIDEVIIIGITYQDEEDDAKYNPVIVELYNFLESSGSVTIGFEGNEVTADLIPNPTLAQAYFESPPAWLLSMLRDTTNSHEIKLKIN